MKEATTSACFSQGGSLARNPLAGGRNTFVGLEGAKHIPPIPAEQFYLDFTFSRFTFHVSLRLASPARCGRARRAPRESGSESNPSHRGRFRANAGLSFAGPPRHAYRRNNDNPFFARGIFPLLQRRPPFARLAECAR